MSYKTAHTPSYQEEMAYREMMQKKASEKKQPTKAQSNHYASPNWQAEVEFLNNMSKGQ